MAKFQPKTKHELQELIKDKSVYLGDIDTSLITDMSYLFYQDILRNKIIRIDFSGIENWDVSNVTNMRNMFCKCYTFNQPLNNWNVSNVTDMNSMFFECYTFNQPLNNWNVGNVTDMNSMFLECHTFNQPLNSWKC